MKKQLFTLLILCLTSTICFTQAGIQFYGGVSDGHNRDAKITPNGMSHQGYHAGIDFRLNEGNMYFGGGAEMAHINFIAHENISFFNVDSSMRWVKIRLGLGYKLWRFGPASYMRMKTYASINLLTRYPKNEEEAPYHIYNRGVAAGVLGLGADFGPVTVDVEYERGFFNAVYRVQHTEIDFMKLSLGFRI